MNKLYFGDNLDVVRGRIKDESVYLVYLDPPFNSSANYNVLFRAPSGEESDAKLKHFAIPGSGATVRGMRSRM